ncbi:MAG: MarR family winged helix-turn-helix transcriptional regulator [Planctomycetota bacterium]|jgi:DNA-binding MarR family transcriptional regulator
MPTLEQAKILKDFVEEIFELSKDVWASQSRAKVKNQAEITETEFLTLDLLNKSQPLTVGEIQKHIGVLPAQMSRIVRSLENKADGALIECKINPDDKRKIDVGLTPAGAKAHQAYREMKLGSIEKLLLALSEQDRQDFMRILRQFRETMRKSLEDG